MPAIFTSGKTTLENFKPGFADIIIMDIHLAENTNGIDTSIEIRKISTEPIIYITDDKDEYTRKKAIYESNTVQYITKPFTKLDISIAIDLALKAMKGHDLALKKNTESSILINESIFVKDVQGFKKIMKPISCSLKPMVVTVNFFTGEAKGGTKQLLKKSCSTRT